MIGTDLKYTPTTKTARRKEKTDNKTNKLYFKPSGGRPQKVDLGNIRLTQL